MVARSNPMFDKFHEECGVVAIYGHPESGQAGVPWGCTPCSTAGRRARASAPRMAPGSTVTNPWARGRHLHQLRCWRRCRASWPSATRAIPRPATRWLLNAQPLFRWRAQGASGRGAQRQHHQRYGIARRLERRGAIFQASSDTEVILHLVAHSSERTLRARCAMRCCNWKARFRWCSWRKTASSWRGILTVSGRWRWVKWKFPAAARSTPSLGNLRLRPARGGLSERSRTGRNDHRRPGRHHRERYTPERAARAVCFRARVLLAARFRGFRPGVEESRENLGRLLARECPPMPTWWFRFPIPEWRLLSATRPNRGFPTAKRSSATTTWAARLSSLPRPSAISESS